MHIELQRLPGPNPPSYPTAEGCPGLEELASTSEHPDGRIVRVDSSGAVCSHVAVWWREVPSPDHVRAGAIGGFFASSEPDARRLLHAACEWLREVGCGQAIGPMNANTWQRHRFVIESDSRAPYLLEPRNPSEWPLWWQTAGFEVLSQYSSSMMTLDGENSVSPALRDRLTRSGLVIRPFSPEEFEKELRLIHAISLQSFQENFLYTPLDEASFLRSYEKVRGRVDPDLVRIAEISGAPIGFVFAIPDLEAAALGLKPSLIVKTLAVNPRSHCAGVGSLLVDEVHAIALAKGYTHAIHAMQHESNSSRRITRRHSGTVFRRYALFNRSL